MQAITTIYISTYVQERGGAAEQGTEPPPKAVVIPRSTFQASQKIISTTNPPPVFVGTSVSRFISCMAHIITEV